MPILFMLKYIVNKGAYVIISLFIISMISCSEPSKETQNISFSHQVKELFIQDITQAITHLDSLASDISSAEKHFLASRKYFKKIEPILSELDKENYGFLNQPNILKIEEEDFTDIKIKKPGGYQVLEEEIFTDHPDTTAITRQANLAMHRLKLIKENTHFDHLKTYHFLWMFRKAIIRTAVTGITGFDSPVLENSLKESITVYRSLKKYLSIFKTEFKDPVLFEKWNQEIAATIEKLENGEFSTFDRYSFTKNHTHPQLELWNQTVSDWEAQFPFELAIKNDATSLFSSNTFNIDYFSDPGLGETNEEKIALGKQLFHDTRLSADQTISCGTCHLPEKAFTDGKKIGANVTRNTPTMLYVALQKAFFYDKRAGSLEGQIIAVVENDKEFHNDLETLEKAVQLDSIYTTRFSKLYPNKGISNIIIRNAIASYIRSLTPFNSKFDRNINNLENTLSQNEINGYNLFNGKAKCATCHFAPVFNGTVPPDYKESEIELLGVPQQNDTINAIISKDLGRYNVYKTAERKHFFKTSTVRNVGNTGPYMHNGVYNTLEEVLDFYNRGGGAGIGIEQPLQTLPPDPLNLTEQEINDIIAFMESLSDNLNDYQQ
ncbi:cytochrome-c peroxidase [Aquimarina sp. 2201CG5-10]|uniref:cytochrome-c peroxidase n=1 Tax=Aquimarina callyspongiae TaxID=3098150 RepID=UPI002AB4D4E5|nr:cytochrome c peroxidase [Aquimarina sp. 2201CG5-10]MDY8135594.1 cytochrome c peroxidase [Aquimarina sp. 2201CG5-10]